MVKERVKSIRQGSPSREARIEEPRITNPIVPAREVKLPKSEIKLQQREIKKGAPRTRPEVTGKPGPKPEPRKPRARPERVVPPKPSEQKKPVGRPERVVPPKPSEREKPAGERGHGVPSKPSEQEKPAHQENPR